MSVFVLDQKGSPLMPCSERRARLLLSRGRAVVHRVMPFVIRLKDRLVKDCQLQALELAIDPGSKETGIAVRRIETQVDRETGEIKRFVHATFLANLVHRGAAIKKALDQRRGFRRRRRNQLRYRAPRFDNRTRKSGWLAPSLQHRVAAVTSLVKRLQRWAPVVAIHQELVRFDMQLLVNPEISGIEYQQGELAGYEVREYLLEKWGRQCAYCDAQNTPLEIEHIIARSKGGTNRVSNLTLACTCCNQKKGSLPVQSFVKDPVRLAKLLAKAKAPLKDAAAVNATRWALFETLKQFGLPVQCASGGKTKYNRTQMGIAKDHCLDAFCVGDIDGIGAISQHKLVAKCTGRGEYSRTRLDKYGFPRGYCTREKVVNGFQTGDRVVAEVPSGKKAGRHVGRVAVRASGSFNIQTGKSVVQGISSKHCKIIQRGDGYGYSFAVIVNKSSPKIAATQEVARTG